MMWCNAAPWFAGAVASRSPPFLIGERLDRLVEVSANFVPVGFDGATYFWADVERTSGGYLNEDWRATVGVRHAF